MPTSHVLISLCGEVALLLWGIQMVSAGMQRALGSSLRHFLSIGLKNRFRAVLTGLVVTGLLQSSTATAMMATSFTIGGAVDLVPALAIMLGANVGTTLIVQLVSFDITLVYPALILIGVVLFRRGRRAAARDAGTAVVGLGIILLSLHLLIETMRPLEASAVLRDLLQAVTDDPLLCILLAGLLAWAAHSSVAAMLFIMSLAGAGVVTPQASLALVIGANLGSALNPVIGGLGGDPTRLRLPVGNLLNRVVGCIVALPLLPYLTAPLLDLAGGPARAAALFHFGFNIATAILFVGLLPRQARLMARLLPKQAEAADAGKPQYLNEMALGTPSVALSNAAREVLRMVDIVEAMLRGSQDVFHRDDRDKIAAISRMDDTLDRLYKAIQRYLGQIRHERLDAEEAQRLSDTLALAINLEHIGDIIDRNLMDLAAKRVSNGLRLPEEAQAQVDDMHARLLDHLQLAVAVFMSGDWQAARRLVAEKESFRDIEREATQRHVEHMRAGARGEIETSSLQLDITRDLKRIESHIAATAYGILEAAGQLRGSRLTA
ncbi:Na/Pi cotransporter family protein [Mangrovicella endophytica]|uniref:Na/Pi cotransporter family protein n=1 Tax=Mangrovicella endophytica TaxID=2066697 RepID=UPI000C9EB168|nr:Na/Pi cotransporter family protein [Mangrovicella endophytica]